MNVNTFLLIDGSLMLIGLPLLMILKGRKKMADMKKEPVKKGIPLNWDTTEGLDK